MKRFANAREAKEFLITGIVEEARRESVPLSETERKMLYFSETGWTLPDMMEVSDEFDREYDESKYEKKIARLIRNETKRLRKENAKELASWISAARELKKEDHYISVMVDAAGVPTGTVNDKLKGGILLAIFLGIVVAFNPVLKYLGLWLPKTPGVAGSYTINEKLSNVVGYLAASFLVLYFCGLVYAHFDNKRRVYKICDSLIEPVFEGALKLFGVNWKHR